MSADNTTELPTPPKSWSELTWEQLNDCWQVKLRYGGNPDVARAAAWLVLCKLTDDPYNPQETHDPRTGETLYPLRSADGRQWKTTARELAHFAKKALPWFDYPYGDPGEKEVHDDKGKVIKKRRKAVNGYVSPMHDAMNLPIEEIRINAFEFTAKDVKTVWWRRFFPSRFFALPQVACNNLTWQQYRSLQATAARIFSGDVADEEALNLQAQFLAHILVPRSFAVLDTDGGSIRVRPHWEYNYNVGQADDLVKWWEKGLITHTAQCSTLFYICFQVYQTAVAYYSNVYPVLFQDNGKKDPLRDALTGEVGTINSVMKYAGYAEQQQVYDSNLPFVLDILNTMTKEALEIEKAQSKIKKK